MFGVFVTQSLRGCANSCLPPAAAQEAVVSRAHQEPPPKHSVDRNRPNRPRGSGKKKKGSGIHLATWLICIALKARLRV